MSYTFHPLVDAAYNDHTGFVLVTLVLAFISLMLCFSWRGGHRPAIFVIGVICAVIQWFAFKVSFNTPETIYANVKTTGEFVEFKHEAVVNKSGKSSVVIENKTYVTYKVDGGFVTLPATAGAKYPKTVVLYRN